MQIIVKIARFILYKMRFLLHEVLQFREQEILQEKHLFILDRVKEKGNNIYFNGNVVVTHPSMLTLGNNVHIGDNAYFHTDGGLLIGDNTHLSRNVTIYTSSHHYDGEALPYDNTRIFKPVFIERNVWIGMNVSITPGVTIGEGSIIGLGALISKDVPPYAIVGSPPQRLLKSRSINKYIENIKKGNVGGVNGNILPKSKEKSLRDIKNVFFVLGTGRCGSETLSKILSQYPKLLCRHEPKGRLVRLSTDFAHGLIGKEEVKRELEILFSQVCTIPETTLIYGESDQKYSNLVSIIYEILPNAKFIWLIRKAGPTITSMYSRGWFCDREYDYKVRSCCISELNTGVSFSQARLNGALADKEISIQDWKLMTPFERNCWYWSYWNTVIENLLNALPENSKMVVKLEELPNKINEIGDFLELEEFQFSVIKSNEAQYKLLNSWSEQDKLSYDKWCTHKMLNWYSENVNG